MRIIKLARTRFFRVAIAAVVISAAVVAVSFSPASSSAQQSSPNYLELFDKTEVMIPVRDGVTNSHRILRPQERHRTAAHFAGAHTLRHLRRR